MMPIELAEALRSVDRALKLGNAYRNVLLDLIGGGQISLDAFDKAASAMNGLRAGLDALVEKDDDVPEE